MADNGNMLMFETDGDTMVNTFKSDYANNFRKAGQLTNILSDSERNSKVISFALCLGGYYKGGKTPQERSRARPLWCSLVPGAAT